MNSPTAKKRSSQQAYSRKILDQLATSEEYKIAGAHAKAIAIVESILAEDPECLAAVEELADNFLSLDKHAEAEKAADYALMISKESYIANYTKGFLELARGNWQAAIVLLQKANILQANNPEILRCLGWGLFHAGKQAEGVATLQRALNLRSDDPMILCDLGVCALHDHVFQKAIDYFEKALKASPLNERAYECLQAAKDFQAKLQQSQSNSPQIV